MNYKAKFEQAIKELDSMIKLSSLVYDKACREKGSASYNAAKALGAMRANIEAKDLIMCFFTE